MEIKAPPDLKIFNPFGLEIISSSFDPGGHESMLYYVPPAKAGERICRNCDNPALFIFYDKSHDGEKCYDSYCRDCAPDYFIQLLNERKAG